jgi:hypothetical protein
MTVDADNWGMEQYCSVNLSKRNIHGNRVKSQPKNDIFRLSNRSSKYGTDQ